MEKVLSAVLALAMVFSLSCTAFAVEEVPYEPVASETYYISGEDAVLTINSCTWSPSSQDVKIGWYNVDTRVTYTVTYEGGDINSKRVNSSGVPDGDYKVCIVNGGSKSITGAMQYEVK